MLQTEQYAGLFAGDVIFGIVHRAASANSFARKYRSEAASMNRVPFWAASLRPSAL